MLEVQDHEPVAGAGDLAAHDKMDARLVGGAGA
jgi:hypothetical protein